MGELKRTIKEQEFLKAYIEEKGNATSAYIKVFPKVSRINASVYGIRLLKKVGMSISELLDRIGVDDHLLSEKLQAGLDSPNKYIVARYLDMAFKLKAKYPIEEARLRLPGAGDGATSIILRELIYSTNQDKDNKDTKKEVRAKLKEAITVDNVPF